MKVSFMRKPETGMQTFRVAMARMIMTSVPLVNLRPASLAIRAAWHTTILRVCVCMGDWMMPEFFILFPQSHTLNPNDPTEKQTFEFWCLSFSHSHTRWFYCIILAWPMYRLDKNNSLCIKKINKATLQWKKCDIVASIFERCWFYVM